MNILLIERDGSRRRMFKDMLAQSGATVIEIGGATELPGLAGQPLALALVEVEGGGEGMAAIVRLRARGENRPPVIALAAEAELVEPSHAAGADEVLVEPVSMVALFDAVGRLVDSA